MCCRTIRRSFLPFFVLITPLFLSGCSSDDTAAPMQMPPSIVKFATPRETALQETVFMAGSLVASQQVVLSSEREGVIRQILVQGGQQVQAGQLLMQMSNDTARAELKRAQADVNLRQDEAERAKSLLKRNVTSQYDVDKALAQLDTALANEELVNVELDKRKITAPFSGYLGIRKVNVGSYVHKGDVLIELVSLNPLYVDFKIPETAIASVHTGDTLALFIPALANLTPHATIRSISPSVDEQTRTIAVRATIDNADLQLKPGLFAKIQLPLKSRAKVFWLPETAIFQEGDSKMVMLSEAGKARRIKVEVLSYQNGEVAISDGVSASDIIVSEGHHKVPFDGMAVMSQEQMLESIAGDSTAKDDAGSAEKADAGDRSNHPIKQ